MSKKCEHTYKYTLRRLFMSGSLLGRKKCDKCGEEIILSIRFRTIVITYVLILAGILIFIIKNSPYILINVSANEKNGLIIPGFITVYSVGLYFLLKKAEYISCEKDE